MKHNQVPAFFYVLLPFITKLAPSSEVPYWIRVDGVAPSSDVVHLRTVCMQIFDRTGTLKMEVPATPFGRASSQVSTSFARPRLGESKAASFHVNEVNALNCQYRVTAC